jgi:predicted signal transduction protein with EAL and GGDEF domain
VLHPGDEAAASAASLRLRAALEESFRVGGIRVHIDASVGIAMFPEHARDGLGLLQRSDVAMYEAKRTRTGHEVYLPERDHHSRRRLELLGELRDGLAEGELVLHYQPKAEIATGEVHGVEALVRWAHPRRGLLMPGDFLPLADHSGLGRSLTAFVLDRALEEIGDHRRHGFDLSVAVNLGPADLIKIDRSFVMRLADDERDAAIVHTTVDLGRRLGMRVVAEGVETAETWDTLAGLHCDEAQGFFLGRPMTANALAGWLRERAAA